MKERKKTSYVSTIIFCFIGLVLGILLRKYVIEIERVSGESMYPTLNDKEYILVSKTASEYKRGDIVIFDSNDYANNLYIKRVIGIAGDHIKIANGKVYLNNKQLKEDYLDANIITEGEVDLIVPKGEYFVLGDNRGNSKDSRVFGTVKKKYIKSKLKLELTLK